MTQAILKTKYWEVELAENQAYLGRSFVTLIRDCPNLSELKEEEIEDFFKIVKSLEKAIKKAFGAEMFNWTCLMNDAYKKTPPNPQVHWHMRPRYRTPVNFEGKSFEDTEFAHHYDNKRKDIISEDLLKKITDKIKQNLK